MNAVRDHTKFYDRMEQRRETLAWLDRQEDKEGIIGDALAEVRALDVLDYVRSGDRCALGELFDAKVMAVIDSIRRRP